MCEESQSCASARESQIAKKTLSAHVFNVLRKYTEFRYTRMFLSPRLLVTELLGKLKKVRSVVMRVVVLRAERN